MPTIKAATLNAIAFAVDALGADRTQGIRLEEVESAIEDGQPAWHITLSMVSPNEVDASEPLSQAIAALSPKHREYKTFTVLKETGEVTSMRIRELSSD